MTSQNRIEFKKSPVPAEPNDTISIVHTARIAGLLYGAIIVFGIFEVSFCLWLSIKGVKQAAD